MNCFEDLSKFYLESWLGNIKEINQMLHECLKEYRDVKDVRKKIRKALSEVDSEVEIPEVLRRKGITYEDLLRVSLHRIFEFLIRNQIELKVLEKGKLKYSVIDLEYKKIVRGICDKCNGKKLIKLRKSNGLLIQYHQVIYAEIFDDIEIGIEEIIQNLE